MIVPAGTRVVTLVSVAAAHDVRAAGAVGEVVDAPLDAQHAYRVRMTDGFEASLKRTEFALLNEVKAVPPDVLADRDLADRVIYRCVVGSRAYGLDHEGSDWDRRGIYLAPAERHWSLYGVPEQLENKDREECYWELQKFLVLALKANPNILECLYTPVIEHKTELAEELLRMRDAFLSRLVYQTFNGYVLSQFKKFESRRLRGLEPNWRHAMHLIRLLGAGITILREQRVPVRVDDREALLAIRRGEVPWREVEARRRSLHADFERAYAETTLPDRPDYERANAFLVRARRHAAGEDAR